MSKASGAIHWAFPLMPLLLVVLNLKPNLASRPTKSYSSCVLHSGSLGHQEKKKTTHVHQVEPIKRADDVLDRLAERVGVLSTRSSRSPNLIFQPIYAATTKTHYGKRDPAQNLRRAAPLVSTAFKGLDLTDAEEKFKSIFAAEPDRDIFECAWTAAVTSMYNLRGIPAGQAVQLVSPDKVPLFLKDYGEDSVEGRIWVDAYENTAAKRELISKGIRRLLNPLLALFALLGEITQKAYQMWKEDDPTAVSAAEEEFSHRSTLEPACHFFPEKYFDLSAVPMRSIVNIDAWWWKATGLENIYQSRSINVILMNLGEVDKDSPIPLVDGKLTLDQVTKLFILLFDPNEESRLRTSLVEQTWMRLNDTMSDTDWADIMGASLSKEHQELLNRLPDV